MNINYKEPQFELFPANSATLEDINKPKFLLATLTLSTESLVILVILAIMIALFSFSLGVERGRHLAAQTLDDKVSAAWNVGGRRLAVVAPPVAAQATAGNLQASQRSRVLNTAQVTHANLNSRVVLTTVPKAVAVKPVVPAANLSMSSVGKWTVQLATYKSENYAKQDALGLKAKGYPVFIVKFKEYYLVCAGQFASQEQANAFSKKVPSKQGNQVRRI